MYQFLGETAPQWVSIGGGNILVITLLMKGIFHFLTNLLFILYLKAVLDMDNRENFYGTFFE